MTEIFSELAIRTANALSFKYDSIEDEKVTRYLKRIHIMTIEKQSSE